jgi:predicted nucleic acid-binding protein
MARSVLIDTGPMVAILCREDAQHGACVATLKRIDEELVTCWPVVTEAIHLMGPRVDRVQRLLAMLVSGAIHCVDLPLDAPQWLTGFYDRYRDHAPDLADASLVLLAERMGIADVFSLDHRDFAIYRTSHGRALHVLTVE